MCVSVRACVNRTGHTGIDEALFEYARGIGVARD